jgi:hypothetical protein
MSYWVIFLAVLARFAPHLPNVSPLYGALLFGGAHLRSRDTFRYPLVLIAVTDVLLYHGVYRMRMGWAQAWVWLGFAAFLALGRWVRRAPSGVVGALGARIAAASLAGSTAFWILSNFGVWLSGERYPLTPEGLLACYVAALPFFRRALLSTLLGSAVLFGAHGILRRRIGARAAGAAVSGIPEVRHG